MQKIKGEIARILPPGISGNCEIRRCHLKRRHKIWCEYLQEYHNYGPGTMVALLVDGATMMGEGTPEWTTSRPVLENAFGDVLIAGLGIGMILPSLCRNPRVKSITVVELSKHVIALVEPYYRHPKLRVVRGDIRKSAFLRSSVFDTIWLDIWPDVSLKNLPEMQKLKRQLMPILRPGGWFGMWVEDILKTMGCCIRIENGSTICLTNHLDREEIRFEEVACKR